FFFWLRTSSTSPSSPGSLRPLASLYGRRLTQALELAQARNLVLECGQLILDCARPPRNLFLCCIQLALDFRFHLTQLALAHHLELRAKHCLIRVEARAERRHVLSQPGHHRRSRHC